VRLTAFKVRLNAFKTTLNVASGNLKKIINFFKCHMISWPNF
jgi:hypothetical protein